MHDSATDDQLHLHMSQLDRPPSQMDSRTAGSPSALLQAPARAVRPTDVGGSYDNDKGDQLATEMATVIKSPATAVATSDSGLAGRSHTDLRTTEFPDDDMIEVMPCIYSAICLLPYLLLAMLTSMSCFGFEANFMSALSVSHWKRRIMLLTSAVHMGPQGNLPDCWARQPVEPSSLQLRPQANSIDC